MKFRRVFHFKFSVLLIATSICFLPTSFSTQAQAASSENNALLKAVFKGDITKVEILPDKDANPDIQDNEGIRKILLEKEAKRIVEDEKQTEVQGTDSRVSDFKFRDYLQKVDTKIRWQWAPPPIKPEEDSLVVRFDIKKDGSIDKMSVVVEESSGNLFLDQAALRAVYAAHPFPPLPDAYTNNILTVYMHFMVREGTERTITQMRTEPAQRRAAKEKIQEEKALAIQRRAVAKERMKKWEAQRLKQEKLNMRAVEQCNKGWKTRKSDKISGAFGINFGCKFDPELALGKHSLVDGTPMYLFKPKNKFRSFTRYYVLITPKTHQVYSIWGIADVENTPKGVKEQAVILSILEKKYGKRKDSGIIGSLYDAESIAKGDKSIMVKVSGFTDYTLDIRYYDDTLKALAEEERIEIESSKTDDSGL